MNTEYRKKIRTAAEELQSATGNLMMAIDEIQEEDQRKKLRRDFAELIAFIEERFVFNLSQ